MYISEDQSEHSDVFVVGIIYEGNTRYYNRTDMEETKMNAASTSQKKHVVVVGGGFAGLNFIKHIKAENLEVTVVDRDNYHCFPPLFYQVASAGLDSASICFPLRREIRKRGNRNIRFHMGEVRRIDTGRKRIYTDLEELSYDVLVISAGTTNNFFNMPELEKTVYTLKSTSQSLRCRNDILDILERAALEKDPEKQKKLLSFVVIGGGPTGVEIAGAIGEMKRYVLPREYPTIPQDNMTITLVEGSQKLLGAMSAKSSETAYKDLRSLMVDISLGSNMRSYADKVVTLANGQTLDCSLLIWTAGVTGEGFEIVGKDGADISGDVLGRGRRWKVDGMCRVKGLEDVYALGDISIMEGVDADFPNGHPQLAQVAIQEGKMVAENLNELAKADSAAAGTYIPKLKTFKYNDKGSMATIGRNRAVVDMKKVHLSGFMAWLAWMFVHLVSLLGMRNKITVLINWIWAYFNYSTSLRLLIHPCKYPARRRWNE